MKKKTLNSKYGSCPLLCSLKTTVCTGRASVPTPSPHGTREAESHINLVMWESSSTAHRTLWRTKSSSRQGLWEWPGVSCHWPDMGLFLQKLTWHDVLVSFKMCEGSRGCWEEIRLPQSKFRTHVTGKAHPRHCSSSCLCDTKWGWLCKGCRILEQGLSREMSALHLYEQTRMWEFGSPSINHICQGQQM